MPVSHAVSRTLRQRCTAVGLYRQGAPELIAAGFTSQHELPEHIGTRKFDTCVSREFNGGIWHEILDEGR